MNPPYTPRLDLMTRELRMESGLGDSKLNFFDFPNINPNNLGRNYRYTGKDIDYKEGFALLVLKLTSQTNSAFGRKPLLRNW